MSDLQRSFARAKLAGLPFDPPMPSGFAEEDEEQENEQQGDLKSLPQGVERQTKQDAQDEEDSSSASSVSSTGTIRPSPSKHLFARPKGFVTSLFSLLCFYVLCRRKSDRFSLCLTIHLTHFDQISTTHYGSKVLPCLLFMTLALRSRFFSTNPLDRSN